LGKGIKYQSKKRNELVISYSTFYENYGNINSKVTIYTLFFSLN